MVSLDTKGGAVWWGPTDATDELDLPTLSTGANKVDVLTFLTVDNGTTWLGFLSGLDLR